MLKRHAPFTALCTAIVLLAGCAHHSAKQASPAPTSGIPDAGLQEIRAAHTTQHDALLQEINATKEELKTIKSELAEIKKGVTDIVKMAQAGSQEPPAPPPVERVSFDDDPVLGDPNAKVAIVEFSDFQCPFCRRFETQTFPALKKKYIDSGKVKLIFRDFPLEFHPQATPAAAAANCAGRQNAFWEMHGLLFDQQAKLKPELYTTLAQQLKLNMKTFKACLKDEAITNEIMADFTEGNKFSVNGTPTFFIGRVDGNYIVDVQRIVGAQLEPAFAQILDGLLENPKE